MLPRCSTFRSVMWSISCRRLTHRNMSTICRQLAGYGLAYGLEEDLQAIVHGLRRRLHLCILADSFIM